MRTSTQRLVLFHIVLLSFWMFLVIGLLSDGAAIRVTPIYFDASGLAILIFALCGILIQVILIGLRLNQHDYEHEKILLKERDHS